MIVKNSKDNSKHSGLADCDCPDCAVDSKSPKKLRALKSIILIIVGLAVIGVGAWYSYDYYRNHYGTDQQKANYQLKKIVAKVGKLIVLPTDETPVLATISDADTLAKQQSFFLGAKDGDKLLIYQKALKAIVWSPQSGKLVNVGPVIYDQNADKAVSTGNTNPTVETKETTTTKTKK